LVVDLARLEPGKRLLHRVAVLDAVDFGFHGGEENMKKLFAAIALLALASAAQAQGFPNRSITLIVPFPPGGSTDTAARIVGEKMRGPLGQPVVIENVGGAGGTIGLGRLARANPDGYTIDIGQWDTHVGAIIYPITFDLQKDFEPVGLMSVNPQL